jgi:WD40 repeat protein
VKANKRTLPLIFLLLVLQTACATPQNAGPAYTSTPTQAPASATPTQAQHTPSERPATDAPIPTVTPPRLATATPGNTGILTTLDTSVEIPVCVGAGEPAGEPGAAELQGTLVYQPEQFAELKALERPGPAEITIAEHVLAPLGFSPNGEWFAYVPDSASSGSVRDLKEFSVVLISKQGETRTTAVDAQNLAGDLWSEEHFGEIGSNHWINNDLLYITFEAWFTYQNLASFIDNYPAVLDPFSGLWRPDLLEDLPAGYLYDPFDFSPDLKRALYFGSPSGVMLQDLAGQKTLWQDDDFGSYGSELAISEIDWSPDGSQAVVSGVRQSTYERIIYLVTKNGLLLEIIGGTDTPVSYFWPAYFRWSPNGQYLAMYDTSSHEIFILDTISSRYILRCPLRAAQNQAYDFVWSPHNDALLYGTWGEKLRLLELESGQTYELKQGGMPAGWVEDFQFGEGQ